MAKKKKPLLLYNYWVLASGRGAMGVNAKGQRLGHIVVESRNSDQTVIKEKAYEQLQPQCTNAKLFDLNLTMVQDKQTEQIIKEIQ